MNKLSNIQYAIFCLAVFAVVGVSHAGDCSLMIEMADGEIITFATNPEQIAELERTCTTLERLKYAKLDKPNKKVLTFEMAESGITISFSLTEKEFATKSAEDSSSVVLYSAKTYHLNPLVERLELAESGIYIDFPVNRDENDRKTLYYYSQNLQ